MMIGLTKLSLDAGLEVNAVNADRETPLHVAAHGGDLASCRVLLDAGAHVSLR